MKLSLLNHCVRGSILRQLSPAEIGRLQLNEKYTQYVKRSWLLLERTRTSNSNTLASFFHTVFIPSDKPKN